MAATFGEELLSEVHEEGLDEVCVFTMQFRIRLANRLRCYMI